MNRAWLHICAAALASAAALTIVVILACASQQAESAQPTTPAAPVACAKDTDCKGERICIQGACVAPR